MLIHTPNQVFQVALAWLFFKPYEQETSELKPRFYHHHQMSYSSLTTYIDTKFPGESGPLQIKKEKATQKSLPQKRCRGHCLMTTFI